MAKGFTAVLLKPNPFVVKFFFNVIHTIFIPHCYYDCGRGIATVHFMLPSNASGTLFRGVLKKLNISTKQGEAIKTWNLQYVPHLGRRFKHSKKAWLWGSTWACHRYCTCTSPLAPCDKSSTQDCLQRFSHLIAVTVDGKTTTWAQYPRKQEPEKPNDLLAQGHTAGVYQRGNRVFHSWTLSTMLKTGSHLLYAYCQETQHYEMIPPNQKPWAWKRHHQGLEKLCINSTNWCQRICTKDSYYNRIKYLTYVWGSCYI